MNIDPNNHSRLTQVSFASSYDISSPALQKRYSNRPYSSDIIQSKGTLDIYLSWLFKILSPLFRLTGTLCPYQGSNVPVEVQFISHPQSETISIHRTFHFANRKPYLFNSQLKLTKNNYIIEFMRFNIGWKFRLEYDKTNKKVTMNHHGYVISLFGILIPLPIAFIVGHGYAEEVALTDDSFKMLMKISHPIFGVLFQYSGTFKIAETP